jgi:hypothetical protein
MDKEALKANTAGRAPRRGSTAKEAAQASKVSDALGVPGEVTLGEETFTLKPLVFNDLILIEGKYGDLDGFFKKIDAGALTAIRDFCWIMLRKSEPELTAEQAGERMPIAGEELNVLLTTLMAASGLQSKETSGNATGADLETETAPLTGLS